MARKKKTATDNSDVPEKQPTALVRVHADLSEKLGIIAAHKKGDFSIAEFLSPLIRAHVEKLYADVVRELNEMLPDD